MTTTENSIDKCSDCSTVTVCPEHGISAAKSQQILYEIDAAVELALARARDSIAAARAKIGVLEARTRNWK